MVRKGRDKKDKHGMRPTERKKEEEEEERHQEAEQWTKNELLILFIYRFPRLTKALCCFRKAVKSRVVIQWPEQKLHTVITEGKSRKVLLLGWG